MSNGSEVRDDPGRPVRCFWAVALLSIGLSMTGVPAFAQAQPEQTQGRQTASNANVPPGFADLVAGKLPAVVNISTTQRVEAARRPDLPQLPPGSPMEEFFRDFFGDMPNRPRETTALGSGFIISPDGYVVTNNHVVENATEILVVLQDETELPAKIIGRDPPTDLAILKVQADKPLPHVEWGDSKKLRPGDWVVAVGNSFGLGGTVTAGIVSATARNIYAGPYDDFIQTDASINRGNSGGPLFSTDGRVVGVNTAIFSPTGGSVGIGFAIPSEIAQDVAGQLREHGSVQRGYLGVQIQEITPELAKALNLPGREGALVTEVTRNTPAAAAGLQPGDVITGFEGKPVQGPRDLARAVAQVAPGSRANVTIVRDGQRRELTVQIAQMRPPGEQTQARAGGTDQSATEQGRLGLQLAPLTPELRKEFGLPTEANGVAVVGVAPGSPAAERGIQPGDVIVRAGQKQVTKPEEVADAVNTAREKGQKSVVVLVQRRQGSQFVPIPLPG